MADPILFEIDTRGVATITLNRPERLNAINLVMRDLLWEYLQACRDHPDVRAVCFRGEGRAFSAGADISEFGTAPGLWESRRARHERDVWGLLLSLPAAAGGSAAWLLLRRGAGAAALLRRAHRGRGCALRAAGGDPGVHPERGGHADAATDDPPGAAADLILTGEPVGTEEALRWGLVSAVVPEEELDGAVETAIEKLLAEPFTPSRPAL